MKFYSKTWRENRYPSTLNRSQDKTIGVFVDAESQSICFASHGKPETTLSTDVDYVYTAEISSAELLLGLSLLNDREIMKALTELESPKWFDRIENPKSTWESVVVGLANLMPAITRHLLDRRSEKDGGFETGSEI